MKKMLSYKDWVLISAYLDNQLFPAAAKQIETRLAIDSEYKRSLDEIAYTRRMLRSLPQKRVPRNFTLSTEKVRPPIRAIWLQPALGFVSIAATVALVVVFAGSYLFTGLNPRNTAVMAPAMVAESDRAADTTHAQPQIINWNPVFGAGGGGGGPDASGIYTGGIGGGALEPPIIKATEVPAAASEPSLTMPQPTATAEVPQKSSPTQDASTLILGLPAPEDEGKIIESGAETRQGIPENPLSTKTILMIISGAIAVLSGAAVLILRRR